MLTKRELLTKNFVSIRDSAYKSNSPNFEDNINYKVDSEKLKEIDLEEIGKFRDFLDRLRALSHNGYRNAYFVDEAGRKIWVEVSLQPGSRVD